MGTASASMPGPIVIDDDVVRLGNRVRQLLELHGRSIFSVYTRLVFGKPFGTVDKINERGMYAPAETKPRTAASASPNRAI